ncbi:MAG: hypothetical protein ACKV22_14205 [Bryobacteraceae bacterium]
MREFASSVLSYTLANVLYTGQQVAKFSGVSESMVDPKNPPAPGSTGEEPTTVSAFLYKKTKETAEKFGDPAAVAFIAGDEYQSKAVDFVFDLLSPSSLSPSYWSKVISRLASQGSLAVDALIVQQSLYAKQMQNTREIFTLVRNNSEKLGIPKSGTFDLAYYMDKAYVKGKFENIWTVEGLGHVYSQRTWNGRTDAEGIMMDGQAANIREESLTMMHAGLGLCFAESLMKQLTPDSTTRETERVLRNFIKLCKNNSREGYAGCALESLGLVTRCFNYPMVDLVQRILADVDEPAWEFFWRGAGRALYFSPGHMLQPLYSPWIAAEQEAPSDRAHKILRAGITWATNVVNMRQPEIFEDLIKRRGADEESDGTIRNGVAASTAMAMDITPEHPVVKDYLAYEPKSTDSEVRRLWTKLVHDPVYNAVHRYQPILRKHKMMDQVFRFQDLDALVDRLEPSSDE